MAASGKAITTLLDNGASAAMLDAKGRTPLAMMPVEALRYCFVSEESNFTEMRAHKLDISGTGPGDGCYVQMPPPKKEPNGFGFSVQGRARSASISIEGAQSSTIVRDPDKGPGGMAI